MRSGRRLLLLGIAALGLAAPAAAGPRVTLKLQNATAHQVFRQLSRQTGIQFQGHDGSGADGFREPAGAKRASFDWKEAALGRVVRDLCATYGFTVAGQQPVSFWFQPGALPKRNEKVVDGVGVALASITQTQYIIAVPGRAEPRTQRNLYLRFYCRAVDGDGDYLGPLTRLTLVDDRGQSHRVAVSRITADHGSYLPDERMRSAQVVLPPGAGWERLKRIEGEIAIHATVTEQQHTLALPAPSEPAGAAPAGESPAGPPPPPAEIGPARLTVRHARLDGKTLDLRARFEWPADAGIFAHGPSAVRILARLSGGRLEPVYGETRSGVSRAGVQFLEYETNQQFDERPVALEVRVPVSTGTARTVPFAFENVALPFSQPHQVREEPLNLKPRRRTASGSRRPDRFDAGFHDPDGGALRLPARAGSDEELFVGLSRRGPDGSWSAVRWRQVEPGGDGVLLEQLAPGTYRVRVQTQRRLPGDTLGPADAEQTSVVEIRRGATAELR